MSESQPPPEVQRLPTFQSVRDQVLYCIAQDGWANAVSGDVRAPTGWFARISIDEAELPEVAEAFEDILRVTELPKESLIGHHLLWESVDRQVAVKQLTASDLLQTYDFFHAQYNRWVEEHEP